METVVFIEGDVTTFQVPILRDASGSDLSGAPECRSGMNPADLFIEETERALRA